MHVTRDESYHDRSNLQFKTQGMRRSKLNFSPTPGEHWL